MSRRFTAAGVAGALTVTLLGAMPASQATAPASLPATAPTASPGSPLVLEGPDRVRERSRHGWVYSDFGLGLTAHGEPFELRATRDADYLEQIRVVWERESGPVELPAGSMTSWRGLDDFATVKVLRDGKRIRRMKLAGCFNGDAEKIGPDGPAQNPYPWGCPWHPYTLGSVMGVAEDYSASLIPWGGSGMRLRPGSYDVVAAISPRWRELFGISDEDARTTSRLVVRGRGKRGRDAAVEPAPRQAPAAAREGGSDLQPVTEAPTAAASGAPAPGFSPDLRSLPAFDISLNRRGTSLRFGATVWNGGTGPLVLEGFEEEHGHPTPDPDHPRHLTAYQYFFDGDGNQTGYERVGEFGYHAANHNHWHFEDFARYNLLHDDAGTPGDVAVRSTKVSFCLANTDAVDYTVENADWRPGYTDLSSSCGGRKARQLRQVLSNGSGDTYHQYRAGQAFRVGKLPDGVYWISVEANPADEPGAERDGRNLIEDDYTNNDSVRRIEIGTTRRGERFVRADQVGVIDEQDHGWFFRR